MDIKAILSNGEKKVMDKIWFLWRKLLEKYNNWHEMYPTL